MATYENIRTMSLVAQDTVAQYHFVKPSTEAFGCEECTADTDISCGISQSSGAADEAIDVAFGGVAKVACAGTITVGAALTSDTDGRAKAAGAGDVAHGVALTAGVVGDVISLLVNPSNRLIA